MFSLTALGAVCLVAAAIAAIVSAFLEDMQLSIAAHIGVIVLTSGALQCFGEPLLAAATLATGVAAAMAALAFLLATDSAAGQRGRRRIQLAAGLAIPVVVWLTLQLDATVHLGMAQQRATESAAMPNAHVATTDTSTEGATLAVIGTTIFALMVAAPVALRRRQ